jgi:predicted short-subunit dehydrogenase-like oxidoreductase (DUF2520 family)
VTETGSGKTAFSIGSAGEGFFMTVDSYNLNIGFIGAGKVGTALGSALDRHGYKVTAVSSRNYSSALRMASSLSDCKAFQTPQETADASDLIFITTPDFAISQVCENIRWVQGKMVAHTSGADSRSVLSTASQAGALTGVFHPLATIIKKSVTQNPFRCITVTLEAEPPLFGILEELAHSLGANTIRLREENRAIYHASAVFISNYIATLADIATTLWQEMGFGKQAAEKALLPLLKGAVDNLETAGLPGCLTGPVSRGDTGTLRKHLNALDKLDSSVAAIYRRLGHRTVDIALKKGSINPRQAVQLNSIFNTGEENK